VNEYFLYYDSPIGYIKISGYEEGITSISFCEKTATIIEDSVPTCLTECITQLDEYFKGKRNLFSIPLLINGTDFQKKVWSALVSIPYGKTSTYKEIAEMIKNPKGARAVGNANHNNPIAIIIPCHRVIGANGNLVGYAEGVWRKKYLLDLEKRLYNKY